MSKPQNRQNQARPQNQQQPKPAVDQTVVDSIAQTNTKIEARGANVAVQVADETPFAPTEPVFEITAQTAPVKAPAAPAAAVVEVAKPTVDALDAQVAVRLSRLNTYLEKMDIRKPVEYAILAQQQGALYQFLLFNLTQDMGVELNRRVVHAIGDAFREHGNGTLSTVSMMRNWHQFMRTERKLRDEAAAIFDTVAQSSTKGGKAPINWEGFRMMVRPLYVEPIMSALKHL
jgi:hypothetical protein